MNRKTLLAAAVFAGLAVIAFVTMRSPEKGDRQGEAQRPVAKLKDFDTLVVTKGGKSTTLKRDGAAFSVTAPVAYAADKDAAKQAFDAIENLDFGIIVSDQKAKQDEFEVGANGVRVAVKKGDTLLADLHIGKVGNGITFVRVEGKDDVWQAVGSLKYTFDKDASGLRDKSITTFDENDVDSIEVDSKTGGSIVVEKPQRKDGGASEGDAWSVKTTTVKVDPFDKTIPSGIVNALYSWKANDFADDAKPADTGLDAPALKVIVNLKGGKNQAVLIGNKKGEDDYYVKTADKPQIFLVKKYNLERINKRPIDFRDKTMCNLSEGEISEVTVTRATDPFSIAKASAKAGDKGAAADAWKLTKPTGATLDTSKVSGITGSFKEWKATGFAEDNAPKATGLDKPTATINAKSNVKGSGCVLKVGAETADKTGYYVEKPGSPDVFVAPKWTVDRVAVKLADLKKK